MKCMMCKAVIASLLVFIIICSFSACAEESISPQTSLQKSIAPFLTALEADDLNGMMLKVYAIDSSDLTGPHSVEELIESAKKKDNDCYEATIDNATLREYIATLEQIRAENFEVADGLNCEDARVCFVFEAEEKLLEITVGGMSKEPYMFEGSETCLTVFINGVELKINNSLAQILRVLYSLTGQTVMK